MVELSPVIETDFQKYRFASFQIENVYQNGVVSIRSKDTAISLIKIIPNDNSTIQEILHTFQKSKATLDLYCENTTLHGFTGHVTEQKFFIKINHITYKVQILDSIVAVRIKDLLRRILQNRFFKKNVQ